MNYRNRAVKNLGEFGEMRKITAAAIVLAASMVLPGKLAYAADLIPNSISQVGAWKIAGYTQASSAFSHCALLRVQSQGFGLAVGLTSRGTWTLAMEAPDWGLTPNEIYTTSIFVTSGGGQFTFSGRATTARSMVITAAPEIFPQLRSGRHFSASANARRYEVSLDGIEAAGDRLKQCARQYGGIVTPTTTAAPATTAPSKPAPQDSASVPASDPLVISVQTLLAALGYDVGTLDGVVGPKTSTAVAAFQQRVGEQVDSRITEGLRTRLQAAIAERGSGSAPSQRASSSPAPRESKAVSSGTGFFIGPDIVITNHHVVDECVEIRMRKHDAEVGSAKVIALSRGDDLAALRAVKPNDKYLKLRIGVPVKPAEPVLVFGYPLAGALSSSGNTTLGNITALAGLKDDSRFIQVSASVQPGNSGGPVLDESGRLVGVIEGKLDALKVARVTGDIPQNVNFAIRSSTLANFLEANGVAYEVAINSSAIPNTQLAEQAEAASVQLECRK